MTGRIIIGILIAINLALAARLIPSFRNRAPLQTEPLQGPDISNTVPLGPAVSRTRPSSKGPDIIDQSLPWERVASRDLKQYVRNLRAIQCPDETIADIILAEVNRRFAAREKALKLKAEHFTPWDVAAMQGAALIDRQRSIRGLWNEKRALLKDLLGFDLPLDPPAQFADGRFGQFEAAFRELPQEKQEAARAIHDRYWNQKDDLRRRTMGYFEPEDRAGARRILAERNEAMANLLSPEQIENFELKTSDMANLMRREMAAFEASDTEFRAIFRLVKPLEEMIDPRSGQLAPDLDEADKERMEQAGQQFEQQMKVLLGESRHAEFERAQDSAFKRLVEVTQQSGLPRESAIKAFDMQKLAQQEGARISGDGKLSPEQRQQSLEKLQKDFDQGMIQVLGDKNFQTMRLRGFPVFYDPAANRRPPAPAASP